LFTERRRDTSVVHQIATMAVFSSPLLTIAANPQSIVTSPAVDVIKSIPAVWDETIVVPGSEIGELAAYARRSGTAWFLAVMCGTQARSLKVPLTFLGQGQYQGTLVSDEGQGGAGIKLESRDQTRLDSLALDLAAGGGFVARFSPK